MGNMHTTLVLYLKKKKAYELVLEYAYFFIRVVVL